jgi:RHS repeat-associated protein
MASYAFRLAATGPGTTSYDLWVTIDGAEQYLGVVLRAGNLPEGVWLASWDLSTDFDGLADVSFEGIDPSFDFDTGEYESSISDPGAIGDVSTSAPAPGERIQQSAVQEELEQEIAFVESQLEEFDLHIGDIDDVIGELETLVSDLDGQISDVEYDASDLEDAAREVERFDSEFSAVSLAIEALRVELEEDPEPPVKKPHDQRQDPVDSIMEAGEPVRAYSGALVREETDIFVEGRGLNFAVVRFYNSQCYSDGVLGRKWRHSFEDRLHIFDSGTILRVTPRGDAIEYARATDTSWLPEKGNSDLLTERPGGGYRITNGEGLQRHFDRSGLLTRIEDRYGNNIALAYEDGQLVSVSDSLGRQYTFEYLGDGKLDSIIDHFGRAVHYAYEDGLLVRARGFPPGAGRASPEWNYEYVNGTDPRTYALLAAVRDVDGVRLAENDYGLTPNLPAFNRVWRQLFRGGAWYFDYEFPDADAEDTDFGGTTRITTPDGLIRAIEFDSQGRPVEVREQFVDHDTGTLRTVAHASEYDREGRLIRHTDANGVLTEFDYLDGPVTELQRDLVCEKRLVSPDGQTLTTRYEYGPYNQISAFENEAESRTEYTLDSAGNVLRITFPTTAGVASAIAFEYDQWGNIVAHTDPRGLRTEYRYALAGSETGLLDSIIEDPAGSALETIYERNATGDIIAIDQPDATRIAFSMDDRGQPLSRSIDGVETWRGTYDAYGRLLTESERRLDFDRQPMEYDWVEKVYTRDSHGQVVRAEVSVGGTIVATRVYAWDRMGRMIAQQGPGSNDANFVYDMRGNPVAVTRNPGTEQEATKRFLYDDGGAIARIERAEGYSIDFTKDGFGRSTGSRDSRGVEDRFSIDALGRITDLERFDAAGTLQFAMRYVHDQMGLEIERGIAEITSTGTIIGWRAARSTYDEGLTRKTYESPAGLVLSEDHNLFGELVEQSDNLGNRATFVHDAFGRLTSSTTEYSKPDGGQISFTTRRSYDADGEAVEQIDPLGNRTRTRSSVTGTRICVSRQDGATICTETDPARFATRHSVAHMGQEAVEEWIANEDGELAAYVDPAGNTLANEYDHLGRLTRTLDGEGRVAAEFEYDALGRLETATDGRGVICTVQYDELNRPVIERFRGAGTEPLERSFTYDDMGRLASVTTGDSLLEMEYDSFGRLTRHVQDGVESTRSYDDHAGTLTVDYADGRRLIVHRDALGRTTEISTAGATSTADYIGRGGLSSVESGPVSFRYTYDAGGRLLSTTTTTAGLQRRSLAICNSIGQVVVSVEGDEGVLIERDFLDRVIRTRRINDAAMLFDDVDTLAQDDQAGIDAYVAGLTLGEDIATYKYDANGNRLSDGDGTYGYDRSNRRVGTWEHDAAGNVTFDGTYRYRYDGANLVDQIDDAAGNLLISFSRDGLGQVIGFTEQGRAWRIERDGNNPVRYVCDADGEEIGISWGFQSDQILVLEALGQKYRFAYSRRGDVVAVFDTAGELQESYNYGDFGTRTIFDPEGVERDTSILEPASHGFASHPMLGANDLLDAQARLYRTSSGRFTAPDPSGLADGHNPYAYAHNDPYTFIDRDGRSATVTGLGIGLIVGSVYATGHCLYDLVSDPRAFAQRGVLENIGYYVGELGMIALAGAGIGLAVDTAPVWGGLLSAGLMGAGSSAALSVVLNGPDPYAYAKEGVVGGTLGVVFFGAGWAGQAISKTGAGRAVISGVTNSRAYQLAAQTGRLAYGYGASLANRGMSTWVGRNTVGRAKDYVDDAVEFMIRDAEGTTVARTRWAGDLSTLAREKMTRLTYRSRFDDLIGTLADDVHPRGKYTGQTRASDFWAMQQFKDEVMDALTPPAGGWANHSAFAEDFWKVARRLPGYADHFAGPSTYGYAGRVMRPASNGGQFLESIHIHHLRPKSLFPDISTLKENLVLLPQSTHNSFVHTKRYLYTGWGSSLSPKEAMRQALRNIFPRQWDKGLTAAVVQNMITLPEFEDIKEC